MGGEVLYREEFRLHSPKPYSHPESPERLDWALEGVRLAGWPLREPGLGDTSLFLRVHAREYYEAVMRAASQGEVVWLDPDTYVSPGTPRALEALAGAVTDAVEIAARGEGPVAVLGRPPGHHAGRSGRGLGAPTLGFCVFNASALTAKLLSERGRTAVLDFDAHHGNGTQDILWAEPVLHVDIHQDPSTIYPGTGFPSETGAPGLPVKANICVPPGAGDDIYADASRLALSIISDYDPDYIVVSAGFDAYIGDTPFTELRATSATFNLLGRLLSSYSERLVVVLEGGYSIGLREGLAAFLRGLEGREVDAGETTSSSGHAWEWYMRRRRELLEAIGRG
ncbi:MAG: hypothetical protein F7C34_02655 [Desulfurococcales archaeon]|nr:hypothetical protein [Desulfurococcales archaeon]